MTLLKFQLTYCMCLLRVSSASWSFCRRMAEFADSTTCTYCKWAHACVSMVIPITLQIVQVWWHCWTKILPWSRLEVSWLASPQKPDGSTWACVISKQAQNSRESKAEGAFKCMYALKCACTNCIMLSVYLLFSQYYNFVFYRGEVYNTPNTRVQGILAPCNFKDWYNGCIYSHYVGVTSWSISFLVSFHSLFYLYPYMAYIVVFVWQYNAHKWNLPSTTASATNTSGSSAVSAHNLASQSWMLSIHLAKAKRASLKPECSLDLVSESHSSEAQLYLTQ